MKVNSILLLLLFELFLYFIHSEDPQFAFVEDGRNDLQIAQTNNIYFLNEYILDSKMVGGRGYFLSSSLGSGSPINPTNLNAILHLTIVSLNSIPLIQYNGYVTLSQNLINCTKLMNAKILSIQPLIIAVAVSKII